MPSTDCLRRPALRTRLAIAVIFVLFTAPAFAGGFLDSVNDSITQVGRATVAAQDMPRTPEQVSQILRQQVVTAEAISPQAADALLTALKALTREQLDTVAADVSTCVIVSCHGLPAAKVASLAERLVASLRDAASQESSLWTRGVAILSALIALLSVVANVAMNLATRRRAST